MAIEHDGNSMMFIEHDGQWEIEARGILIALIFYSISQEITKKQKAIDNNIVKLAEDPATDQFGAVQMHICFFCIEIIWGLVKLFCISYFFTLCGMKVKNWQLTIEVNYDPE